MLTPRFPYPPIGGDRLRIYQICRMLSPKFELSLLSLCESEQEMEAAIPQDSVFSYVERIYHGWFRRGLGCLGALPSRIPLQVGYYRNPHFARRLEDLLPRHNGVLAHLIRTGAYLMHSEAPRVLEMTDAISLAYERGGEIADWNPLRAFLYRAEAKRLIRFEREMVRMVDLTVLVSAIDRRFLLPGVAGRKIQVCSNGVDTEALPFDYSSDGKTIVFIGNNIAQHNADAAVYFAEEILPLVRGRCPSAQFKVVGPIRDRLVQKLRREPGVLTTGEVKDVAEAVKCAAVGVCPVRFGAGVQNKLLEYMSLGIPSVTSSIGKEGLDVTPGVHLFVADATREWVDYICELLENRDLGSRIARAARAFVEKEHSWTARMTPLVEAMTKLMSRPTVRKAAT